MRNMRYKKLSGLHAGHVYQVMGPVNELDSPMRWSLQSEDSKDQKLIVAEDELMDKARWQPMD